MKLYIKNMVCERCVMVIKNVMQDLGLKPLSVVMGEIDFADSDINSEVLEKIRVEVEPLGFALVSNKKLALVEQVKTTLIKLLHNGYDLEDIKLSDYLKDALKQDYQSLSQLFSSVEGVTIEKYFIHLKVERIKELLVYNELSLTEISYRLGYSSLAHLSSQFKQVAGISPSAFKKIKASHQRLPLDKIS